MHVINEAVIVVIYSIVWNLVRIGPHVCYKILMSPVPTVVHDRNNHRRIAVFPLDDFPSLRQAHVPEIRLVFE